MWEAPSPTRALPNTSTSPPIRARGFVQGRLTKGEAPGYDAPLRFLVGDATDSAPSSPVEAMPHWQADLILLPQERAEPFASPNASLERDARTPPSRT